MNKNSERLAALIQKALLEISPESTFAQGSLDAIERLIEVPRDQSMGDLAFPCFLLAKEAKKAPPQIATLLAESLSSSAHLDTLATSVRAVGPYVNVTLNKALVAADVIPAILDNEFLSPRARLNERVMIEYSQPNTHKAFHVGHTRCASLGDSLSRMQKWNGFDVVPVNYPGDEGTHVAKCLWYLLNYHEGDIPQENRVEFLGGLYVAATELLDLGTYSKAPFPGVTVAEIIEFHVHPEDASWQVVTVRIAPNSNKTVVCGAKGFSIGNHVAYAAPGKRVKGKAVGLVDKKGIVSEGMICSEAELGLGNNSSDILILPKESDVGTEVAELFRTEQGMSLESCLATVAEFEQGVSKVLQQIESGKGEIYDLWRQTREWCIEDFHRIYEWLNCSFEHFFFESELGEAAKEIAREYLQKGVLVEDAGAIGCDLSAYGLGFCILIKRDGTANYAARDLALATRKFSEFGVDRSYYVVDSAQTLHFQQVFKILELMGFAQAQHCKHIAYGQVVRPDGKMSSRKGNVILFSELQDRLISIITSEYLEKYRGDWADDEITEAARKLALATVRYGMLNQENNSQIVFDLDEWTSRSGNTGPYLMYQYARINSITKSTSVQSPSSLDWHLLNHESEHALIMALQEFPSVVSRAVEAASAQPLCAYLYDLTKEFSRMYQNCSILNAESAALKEVRLALASATGMAIKAGLDLLGITVLERM